MPVKLSRDVPDNPFEWFDGILVINLDRHTERWVRFCKMAAEYGLSSLVQRVPGVYCPENGAYGCSSSHKKCLEIARDNNWDNVLILEDDVDFLYDRECTREALRNAIYNLRKNPGWEVWFLGGSMRKKLPENVDKKPGDLVFSKGEWFGSFAYCINRASYSLYAGLPDDPAGFSRSMCSDVILQKLRKCIMYPAVAGVSTGDNWSYTANVNYGPSDIADLIIARYEYTGLLDKTNLKKKSREEYPLLTKGSGPSPDPVTDISGETEENPFRRFDGILVLNLDFDITRWQSFVKEARRMGIYDRVVRIPGVYHSTGSYGCALSHRNAVQYAKDRGWSSVLILEDDIKFLRSREDTYTILGEAMDNLRDDWGLLYLGINIKPGQVPVCPESNPVITSDLYYWGEFSFAINGSMFDFLIESVPGRVEDFTARHRGDMINNTLSPDIKPIVNPCLVGVHSFDSRTGAKLQTVGEYAPKQDDLNIHREYLRHGFSVCPLKGLVTVIVKTFLRPRCLEQFIKSVRLFYPQVRILVADDSDPPNTSYIETEHPDPQVQYWKLPYYCGVSEGRNFLISKVDTKYFVTCDDDFVFNSYTRLEDLLDIIENNPVDILGGGVHGPRGVEYQFTATRAGRDIYYTKKSLKDWEGLEYYDVIPQFFIAETSAIRSIIGWHPELKTAEHSEFFIRCRAKGIRTAYTPRVKVQHEHVTPTHEINLYKKFRHNGEFTKRALELMCADNLRIRGEKIPAPVARRFSCGVFKSMGMDNLETVAGVLNRYEKKYWVSNGTLLGMIRDDDLIAHDSDLDIQMPLQEFSMDIVRDILLKGFEFVHMFGTYADGLELSFIRNGVKIDLFAIYPEGEGHSKFSVWKNNHRVSFLYKNLVPEHRTWKNISLYVPENPEQVLSEEYGPDWRVSDGGKNWDYAWSRHNLIIPPEFNGDEGAYRSNFRSVKDSASVRVTDPVKILNYLREVL